MILKKPFFMRNIAINQIGKINTLTYDSIPPQYIFIKHFTDIIHGYLILAPYGDRAPVEVNVT